MKSLIWTFIFMLVSIPAWAAKPPVITTTSCPQGQATVVYGGCTVQGKWGTKPYTFSVFSGSLPTSLSLNASTGAITGTPTVVGTFSFVIRLTDSNGSPKTYNQQLYIKILATPVPPANPVVITTSTPLPAGLVSSAYTTTVQASGGSGTYTFTVPVGTLPAGLTINSSSGAITGTPTAPGTSSFTVKATDTSTVPSSAQQNYYIAISNPSPAPTYLFQDDFESGNLAAWTYSQGETIQSTIKHAGTYAAQAHYVVCGDSTNPACGASHQDEDLFMDKVVDTTGIPEVHVRGYFYIKSPEAGATTHAAKKLFYFMSDPGGTPTIGWSQGIGVWDLNPGTGPLNMSWFLQNGAIGGNSFNIDCGSTNPPTPITGLGCNLQYNTWYSLEERITYNTLAGPTWNGQVQIWINGTSVLNITGWSLNRDSGLPLKFFGIGFQVDRTNYLPVDEYRYWDDIKIGTSYIGP